MASLRDHWQALRLLPFGCRNPYKVFRVADKMGMPRATVAAYSWKESGFRNVYGGDTGAVNATTPRTEVTEDNWPVFLVRIRAGGKTNGAGFAQGTNKDRHERAEEIGRELTGRDGQGWRIVAHLAGDMEFAKTLEIQLRVHYHGREPYAWEVAGAYHYGLTGFLTHGDIDGYCADFSRKLSQTRRATGGN